MKKLIACVVFAVSSVAANAEFVDGNKLLQWLESKEEVDQALGLGYVAGSFDTVTGDKVCAPANVTVKQVADMTKDALIKVPNLRNKSADVFIFAVASKTWPCKSRASGSNV